MRIAELQERPIPQYIRVCDCNIKVDYYGQPTRNYTCRKFGHIKTDCPFNVQTPPILYSEERNDAQIDEPRNDRPTTSTLTSSMLLLQVRHEEQPEAARDNASLCNANNVSTGQADNPHERRRRRRAAISISSTQRERRNCVIVIDGSWWQPRSIDFWHRWRKTRTSEKNANTHLSNTMNRPRNQPYEMRWLSVNAGAPWFCPTNRDHLQTVRVDFIMLNAFVKTLLQLRVTMQ